MNGNRVHSPVVERPANIPHAEKTRSVSSSIIPSYELDPATRHLLEENECLLFEVNTLRGELQTAQENAKSLKELIASREEEMESMRQKLGDANILAVDASGRRVTFQTECKRLADEKAKLLEDLEKVRSGLDAETEEIRKGLGSLGGDSARRTAALQAKQFQEEIAHFIPIVEHAVATLKRRGVSQVSQELLLETAQKERHNLARLMDSVERINSTDQDRVNTLVEQAKAKDKSVSPTDLIVVVRWIVSQAFTAGIGSTEEKLLLIESLCSNNDNNNNNNEGKAAAAAAGATTWNKGNAERNGNGNGNSRNGRRRN